MEETNPANAYDIAGVQRESDLTEPAVLYRQISYEELEECVFIVRDSIAEFYLAPQGEISIAAVEAALKGLTGAGAEPRHNVREGREDADASGAQYPERLLGETDPEYAVLDESEPPSGYYYDTVVNTPAVEDGSAAAFEPSGSVTREAESAARTDHTEDNFNDGADVDDDNDGPSFVISDAGRLSQSRPQVRQIYRASIKKRKKMRRAILYKYMIACFIGTVLGATLVLLYMTLILPMSGYVYLPSDAKNVSELRSANNFPTTDPASEAGNTAGGLNTPNRVKTGIKYSETFDANFEFYKEQYPDIPSGVYVEYVEPLSGAFTAGIRAGDIITKMRGEIVANYMEMLNIKSTLVPGDIVEVEVFRAGEYLSMDLEVSEGSDDDIDAIR